MSTTKRTLVLTAAGLAAALVLSACGSDADDGESMSGGSASSGRAGDVMFAQMMIPHHHQAVEMADLALANPSTSAEDMASLEAARGPEFDRMWLQMMMEHHRGAVAMAQDVLSTTEDPEVEKLAQAVVDGQEKEIATMQELLG